MLTLLAEMTLPKPEQKRLRHPLEQRSGLCAEASKIAAPSFVEGNGLPFRSASRQVRIRIPMRELETRNR